MKEIKEMIEALSAKPLNDSVYETSDDLARKGSDEVLSAMLELLNHESLETRFLAARTLGKIKDNQSALEPVLSAINEKENSTVAGDLLATLEPYDLSEKYIELFKLYLFGSFKVSTLAEDYLNYKDFDITPRVIKKATKAWNHYTNNVKQDELFALKKIEVEEMLDELKKYVDSRELNH